MIPADDSQVTHDARAEWERHEDEQRRHALTLTPRQRLEWLEQALRMAQAAGVLPARGDGEGEQPTPG